MTQQFFKGLKVVELASVLAGPAVGMFFAELGASVIKIENPATAGDITRQWKLPVEPADSDTSAYYCSVNWGKKIEMLNLSQPADRQRVDDLIRSADVVISNFKGASAKKLGMDYERLKKLQPKLIYAALSGYGADDPRPAFDVILQAEAGFLFMTGEAGREAVKMPVALIDILAAHQLKEGILLALLHRERTGEGSFVATSLMQSAIASLANQATNWLMAGHIPQRMGSHHPNIAPYGDIFYTKDQKAIVLAIGTEKQFHQLCDELGIPRLPEDERFQTNAARVVHRPELRAALEPAFRSFDRADLLLRFEQQQIPAGSIRNMKDVFELPEAQEMILEDELADGRRARRVKTVAFEMRSNELPED